MRDSFSKCMEGRKREKNGMKNEVRVKKYILYQRKNNLNH